MAQFGLLGRKLGHSWSPEIHALLGSAPYSLVEREPEELEGFLQTTYLDAMNVTIPYKKDVISFCTRLSAEAEKLGSVNTMVRRDDGWHGYNTDYFGFCRMLASAGICPENKKVLVLGSGGASLTVVAALRDLGAVNVTVISRSGPDNYENLHRHADAQIIVNTTPVGMYPNNGQAPVSLELFPKCEGVADLIYNPAMTALLLDAESRGIPYAGGLTMLVAQAKAASELFRGISLPDKLIPEITTALQRKMRNIVLIGMPGCGKTPGSEALGRVLNMPVVDADHEIEAEAGMTIPEIFAKDGEDGFRKLETRVLERLGKQTGIILSTGGGCVTRQDNYSHLRQNGFVIWLQRDLDRLPTDGRPLSQSGRLREMYRVREPLYRSFAHTAVDNNGTLEYTIQSILEALK